LFDFYGRLMRAGHQLNLPDPVTHRYASELMKGPEKTLTVDEQETVGSVLRSFVTPSPSQVPGLDIHAAAVERTHVHLLTGPVSIDIHELVGRMKSNSSSAVAGFTFLEDPDPNQLRRTWTRGYWKVFLFDDAGVGAVQKYIQAHNIRRGFGPTRFLWERPVSDK
jgi:REP element-mobilizing transposase RayT